MGCCTCKGLLGHSVECEIKGDIQKLSTPPKRPEEGFYDITLESRSPDSKTQSEVQSPMPSFNYIEPGKSSSYFTERIARLEWKNRMMYERTWGNAQGEETNQSISWQSTSLHLRLFSADQPPLSSRHSLVQIHPNSPCRGDISLPSPHIHTSSLSSLTDTEGEITPREADLTFGDD